MLLLLPLLLLALLLCDCLLRSILLTPAGLSRQLAEPKRFELS
jgi:hypothetical protein